jgi:hypothetical protein
VVLYTWDVWLDDKETSGFELTSSGINELTAPSECKDGTCVYLANNASLYTLSGVNLGQYAGLTFAFWFKPTKLSGPNARVIDFRTDSGQDYVHIARLAASENLQFSVGAAMLTAATCSATGAWRAGAWMHITWTLTPTGQGQQALWRVFVDGALAVVHTGLFPANVQLTRNYFGSRGGGSDALEGYLDSFMIFQTALGDDEAAAIYSVSAACVSSLSRVSVLCVSDVCFLNAF